LLEDVLGWVAVLVVGIIMYFKDIYVLDPLLSVGITLFILFNVFKNFKETILLFLQTVPEQVDIQGIISEFNSIDGVLDSHHTHIWSLDSQSHVLSTHLVVNDDLSSDDLIKVKKKARDVVKDMQIEHITIELEFEREDCKIIN
jgi:cobalt-zinc-cadmium efflux system protein